MPTGGRGAEERCTVQGHPPETGRCDRDQDAPPPPFPAAEVSVQLKMKRQQPTAAGHLSEGPLVEILSRVPYKSLCCFKCVSKTWHALCSDPQIHKRCPQTLTGFFYNTSSSGLSFWNLSGRGPLMVDPSLPFLRETFLPGRYARVEVNQCCGGLLWCTYWKSYKGRNKARYGHTVCNPLTGQWWDVLRPIIDTEDGGVPIDIDESFLAFDAAANPSRFVVFVPLSNSPSGEFTQVAIFSSETQRWTFVDNQWGYKTVLVDVPKCVVLNGTLHLATLGGTIVTVDMEGKVWGKIEMPPDTRSNYTWIGQSQGCLCAWEMDKVGDKLSVWVLEDYGSGKWTLKHTVNFCELFGNEDDRSYSYVMFAIHPDCNVAFLTDYDKMTVSYDMDTHKVDIICTSEEFLDGELYIPCLISE